MLFRNLSSHRAQRHNSRDITPHIEGGPHIAGALVYLPLWVIIIATTAIATWWMTPTMRTVLVISAALIGVVGYLRAPLLPVIFTWLLTVANLIGSSEELVNLTTASNVVLLVALTATSRGFVGMSARHPWDMSAIRTVYLRGWKTIATTCGLVSVVWLVSTTSPERSVMGGLIVPAGIMGFVAVLLWNRSQEVSSHDTQQADSALHH